MANCEYITPELIKALKAEKTKTAAKVLAWLDYDRLNIIKYENRFWLEKTWIEFDIPNYIYNYLISFIGRKMGLKYYLD